MDVGENSSVSEHVFGTLGNCIIIEFLLIMPRLSNYMRDLVYVLGDNLVEMLLHHGLQLVHRAWHGYVVPADAIKPSVD